MTMCASLRREAGIVWARMQKARTLGISLSEETITETVLYNLAIDHQNKNIRIDLATKYAESKHGADWEWWFIKGGKGISFRVQAKRLFPNGNYNSLFHGAGKYVQLDKLVKAASHDGHEPLYCFFNFDHPSLSHAINPCVHSYHRPSFWGCTLALPHEVKAANSNSASVLQPIMFPWHALFCQGNTNRSLPEAANEALRHHGRSARELKPIPLRVKRLIELGDLRRTTEGTESFADAALDFEDVSKVGVVDEGIRGIAAFRDMRD